MAGVFEDRTRILCEGKRHGPVGGKRLRIVDGELVVERPFIGSSESLDQAHVRTAPPERPLPVEARGFDHEGVSVPVPTGTASPLPNGLRKPRPVSDGDEAQLTLLVLDDDVVCCLDDLYPLVPWLRTQWN